MNKQPIENPPVYDAAYFIAKFESIPEEQWCRGMFIRGNQCCAYGHAGKKGSYDDTPESIALRRIDDTKDPVGSGLVGVNDGQSLHYNQPTPKQRVLAWLRDAKGAGL